MKTISLNKFGKVLVSRPAGLEAFKAIRPTLDPNEPIQIDFDDVVAVTPSWFDEFLTNLAEYAQADVVLLPTQNASVLAALPVLITDRHDNVVPIIQRFLDSNGQPSEKTKNSV